MQLTGKRNVHALLSSLEPETVIGMIPADEDDLWNLYNLIRPNDTCTALTTRKVRAPVGAGGGGDRSKGDARRETLKLTISVRKTDFDPVANELRLTGQVTEENRAAGLGTSHSLTIRNGTALSVSRKESGEGWDSVAAEQLRQMLTGDKPGALPALIVQQGRALLVMIREARTVVLAKIESGAMRSKAGGKPFGSGAASGSNSSSKKITAGDKATNKFHENVLEAIRTNLIQTVDSNNGTKEPREILLISPGYWARSFQEYFMTQAVRLNDKRLRAWANQSTVVTSASGLEHGLASIVQSRQVHQRMQGMHLSSDQDAMQRFSEALKRSDGRAWYGKTTVEKAVEVGAVGPGAGELLVLDSLFRSFDLSIRKEYVALTERVKDLGGKVVVIARENPAGDQLHQLGGVAAILTYALQDLDEVLNEDEDEDEDTDWIA